MPRRFDLTHSMRALATGDHGDRCVWTLFGARPDEPAISVDVRGIHGTSPAVISR